MKNKDNPCPFCGNTNKMYCRETGESDDEGRLFRHWMCVKGDYNARIIEEDKETDKPESKTFTVDMDRISKKEAEEYIERLRVKFRKGEKVG